MGRIVFNHANLFDGERAPRPDSHVVVEGKRISALGSGEAPGTGPGDRVIDLGGRTVMPGMYSCHFHSTFEGTAFKMPPMLGLDHPVPMMTLIGAENLGIALQCGITGTIGSSVPANIDASLKEAVDTGKIPGPRMLAGSRTLLTSGGPSDGENLYWYYELGNHGLVRHCNGPDSFRQAVREELGRGADIVKIFGSDGHGAGATNGLMSLNREELRAAVDAAHERGKLVRIHAASKRTILESALAGVDVIDHADRVDAECIDAMLASGSAVVPSLFYTSRLLEMLEGLDLQSGELPFGGALKEPPDVFQERIRGMREEFEWSCSMLPQLVAAGVRIVSGDDYGTFVIAHGEYAKELEFYVKQLDMPPLEVLGWATRNSAQLTGMGDELGTVEVGKLADLLVVDGDPTVDIGSLSNQDALLAILKDGEFAKDTLDGATSA